MRLSGHFDIERHPAQSVGTRRDPAEDRLRPQELDELRGHVGVVGQLRRPAGRRRVAVVHRDLLAQDRLHAVAAPAHDALQGALDLGSRLPPALLPGDLQRLHGVAPRTGHRHDVAREGGALRQLLAADPHRAAPGLGRGLGVAGDHGGRLVGVRPDHLLLVRPQPGQMLVEVPDFALQPVVLLDFGFVQGAAFVAGPVHQLRHPRRVRGPFGLERGNLFSDRFHGFALSLPRNAGRMKGTVEPDGLAARTAGRGQRLAVRRLDRQNGSLRVRRNRHGGQLQKLRAEEAISVELLVELVLKAPKADGQPPDEPVLDQRPSLVDEGRDALGGDLRHDADAVLRRAGLDHVADRLRRVVLIQQRQRQLELDALGHDHVVHPIRRRRRRDAFDDPPLVVVGFDLKDRVGSLHGLVSGHKKRAARVSRP